MSDFAFGVVLLLVLLGSGLLLGVPTCKFHVFLMPDDN